ncbi:MAG: adenylate kinase [Candidatus Bipolaricaulota bacterium]|nr:adenylate kinase [Candidatus Bipolaricaulota bacterium]
MKNVVLLGPPGAGKGTIAVRVAQRAGLLHLSTGDLLRDEVARGTELGKRVQGIMARGELVPDELVLSLVRERTDGRRGVLLDGFPRTLGQAEGLARFLPLDAVIYLSVGKDEVVRRLGGRRVCPSCGAVYNLVSQPPREPGRCDRCGGALVQRSDDAPEVVARRYEVYERDSQPLVDHYRRLGLLRTVDASRDPEAVAADVLKVLGL